MRELSLRELNRTTLRRQLLLERSELSISRAVERLIGLQAQNARPPYVGLWTRLRRFERDDLARAIERREIVKATFIRATLHLLTTDDYRRFRGTLQTWSYLADLQPAFEKLTLTRYRDSRGRELFDLPGLDVEPEDTQAPVRFLPEFDNLLLAHQERTRFVPEQHRKRVFLPGLRIAATVLIDGFVAGTWTTSRANRDATLEISPLEQLTQGTRSELIGEGERLLRFVEPDATSFSVRINGR